MIPLFLALSFSSLLLHPSTAHNSSPLPRSEKQSKHNINLKQSKEGNRPVSPTSLDSPHRNRKDLGITPCPLPAPSNDIINQYSQIRKRGRRNTTIPYSIEELGWEKHFDTAHDTTKPASRNTSTTRPTITPHRALLGTPVQGLGTCRARVDVTFSKGGLENGALRVQNVQSASGCCAKCLRLQNCYAWSWSSRSKICYPKAKTGWTAVPASGVISGIVQRTNTPPAASDDGMNLIWKPTLHIGDHALQNGFAKETKSTPTADYKYVIADPTDPGSDTPVVKVEYLKGRWAPNEGPGGGVLFYAWPNGREGNIGDDVRLEYEVYFPDGFTFNKGGKLPGLQGGSTGCGGGASAEKCFSVRLMWRREGDGEAYMYLPSNQPKAICSTQGTVCDDHAGLSLMRGAFRFSTGKWTKIAITVRMSDCGIPNGLVQVDVDGKTKIQYSKVLYRNAADLKVQAFWFTSWFGGSDASWAPTKDMEAYFRNFKLYSI